MMSTRWIALSLAIVGTMWGIVAAQAPRTLPPDAPADGATADGPPNGGTANKWRAPTPASKRAATAAAGPIRRTGGQNDQVAPLAPGDQRPRQPIARVTEGSSSLPNDAGQVSREYDISSYTARAVNSERPEQTIVDWVLRETGYEAWHGEPFGFLSANRNTLRVYHTPQVQAVVGELVDRFVNTQAETNAFSLRVITIDHPDWRVKAKPMLRPVHVQTQGIQAWLIEREDAALLLAEMRKRTDFREHSSPNLLVNNGQATTVVATRPRSYIKDVTLHPNAWPAFEPEIGQFEEGFSLELSPLLSIDGHMIDAVLKCSIDQLERLVPISMEVPSNVGQRQRTKVEVPQITHCRLHERFRWPTEQILLVGLGVVATPVPAGATPIKVPVPWASGATRADLLVFVESKGKSTQPQTPPLVTERDTQRYRGRY